MSGTEQGQYKIPGLEVITGDTVDKRKLLDFEFYDL